MEQFVDSIWGGVSFMDKIITTKVRMRDGTSLYTILHFPETGNSFPVVLSRNPYRAPSINTAERWTDKGICCVEQDVRGRGQSEGFFYPNIQEINDGLDTIDWIRSQEWCNGKIIMEGGSYLGGNQWFVSKVSGNKLTAITPSVASTNYHEASRFFFGAFQIRDCINWGLSMARGNDPAKKDLQIETDKLIWHLPLKDIDKEAGLGTIPFWQDLMANPDYGPFWEQTDVRTFVRRIEHPVYCSSGWFDCYCEHTLYGYQLMRSQAANERARRFTRCVMGPWAHGDFIGDIDPGPDYSRAKHWEPNRVRFIQNLFADPDADPLPDEPGIKYFVLGTNEWRGCEAWPPEDSVEVPYYLASNGVANTLFGDGVLTTEPPSDNAPSDTFIYDPRNPVMAIGGRHSIQAGSYEQNETEKRQDVLVYSTPALQKDTTVAGKIRVTLFAASSATDTDFTAKLVDVHPDGKAFNLADGIIRGRYRESLSRQVPIEPGRIYEYTIDLWSIAICFPAGHRIRLEISSSSFPQFDRNPNTGHPFGQDAELRIAKQTIFHDACHPSRLHLPVLTK